MSNCASVEATAGDWVARRDQQDWSARDQDELDVWLNAAVTHRNAYLHLQAAWQRADRLAELPNPVQPRNQREGRLLLGFSKWRIAASVFLAVAGTVGIWLQSADSSKTEYRTAVGAINKLALSDGTHVLLNTDSHLSVSFQTKSRQVWLDQGEVFFDVAHDPAKPFIVKAGKRKVTVLGTKFSLRMEGESLWVKVIEGKVQVQTSGALDSAAATVLTGNAVALLKDDSVSISSRSTQQIADELSWREGKLTFSNLTLGEVARQFNRYNNRKLVIADTPAESIVIGGRFEASNVDGFARLVESGFGLDVTHSGEKIIISSKRTGF